MRSGTLKFNKLKHVIHPLPWLSLFVSLGLVLFIWQQERQLVQTNAQARFDREVERTRQAIISRMSVYEDALVGTRGLYTANKSLDREKWHDYISGLSMQERFPGISGMGLIAYVPGNQLKTFEQATRADSASAFSVKTSGDRNEYFVVKYIEPFIDNIAAWGLDISTDKVSRLAAEVARDSGLPTLSAKTVLIEETNNAVGFLLVLPIYRTGLPHATVLERQNALEGWAYASFRVDALMQGIFGTQTPDLDFEIFDGEQVNATTLLYDDDRVLHAVDTNYRPSFSSSNAIKLNGQIWTLHFTTKATFDADNNNDQPTTFLAGGLLASLLLFITSWIIVLTRSRLMATIQLFQAQSNRLKSALNELEERQRTSHHVSNQVLSLAAELKNTAGQQVSGSQEQANVVSQINVAVAELSATAANIDELAQQVSQTATNAADDSKEVEEITAQSVNQSQKGLVAVASAINASEQVAELYQQLLMSLNELNTKNNNMKRILELLKSFSDETHLLALNAAIEAVGAGEYGERFRIVAQEVKRLALRSAQANSEVVSIVREVEGATMQAVQSAESGYLKARQMEKIVGETGQAIDEMREVAENSRKQIGSILASVKEVKELAQVIRAATNQQHSASIQVQEALSGLSVVAYQTAEGSTQVSSAAINLQELSENLNLALVA